jgi:hypothetical protein
MIVCKATLLLTDRYFVFVIVKSTNGKLEEASK